jgi:hypothetical protein
VFDGRFEGAFSLARPKSPIFSFKPLLRKIFAGLISLWTSLASWICFNPEISYFSSLKFSALLTADLLVRYSLSVRPEQCSIWIMTSREIKDLPFLTSSKTSD